jgi:hypothetical protein
MVSPGIAGLSKVIRESFTLEQQVAWLLELTTSEMLPLPPSPEVAE